MTDYNFQTLSGPAFSPDENRGRKDGGLNGGKLYILAIGVHPDDVEQIGRAHV